MRVHPELSALPASETRSNADAQGARSTAADQKIAGVCEAFGEYTPIPAWVWRASFLTLMFCGGIGVLAYAICWICKPVNQA